MIERHEYCIVSCALCQVSSILLRIATVRIVLWIFQMAHVSLFAHQHPEHT